LSLSGIVSAQGLDSVFPGYIIYQPLGFIVFLISGIAENNRAPFDLPEAESELVAGFHTEYSGMRWSLFFMAEYAAMIVVSAVATAMYLGGWYFPFAWRLQADYPNLFVLVSLTVFIAKMAVLLYVYFWLRWTFPRYRYDQLMDLGWKWMTPAALLNIALTAIAIFTVQALDGWRGINTVESINRGVNLTATGKAIMIAFGIAGLFIAAAMLSLINWRSQDFNLKKHRRQLRLVDVPQGAPANAPAVVATTTAVPAMSEG
ncbi:MAG: NADH-quinone oxidoreductase subunit H, partial [Acidobacteriota bacterium]|nr:NADH-quinone oxidoreductase subunit H [Acidobacteriota bacterium]